jgi:hypothetical protein
MATRALVDRPVQFGKFVRHLFPNFVRTDAMAAQRWTQRLLQCRLNFPESPLLEQERCTLGLEVNAVQGF